MLNPVLSLPSGAHQTVDDPLLGIGAVEINLAYPEVREDDFLRPSQDGTVDFTRFMGKRAVSIKLQCWPSKGETLDDVIARFHPFLQPDVPVTLTYSMPSKTGQDLRRFIGMRASGADFPQAASWSRSLLMQWVASDPNVYDLEEQRKTIIPISLNLGKGRQYDMVYDRDYSDVAAEVAHQTLQNAGTRPTYPIIDFYGPMGDGADPTYFEYTLTVVHPVWHVYGGRIQFLPTFIIPADEFVRVDTRDRTVLLNGNVNILGKLDLANTVWAPLLPAANYVNPAEIEYECSLVCANPAVGAVDYFPGLKPQPGEYSGNIEMITPVSGPSIGGTVVDVWGGPFGQGGMSGVTFTFAKNPGSMGGPGTVSFTKISDAHVQVVAPPVDQISTTGPGGYYLTCWRQQPGDVAGYAAYTYLPTTITGISPGSGPITGGTGVSISASFGMSNATGVLFGTVPGVGFYIVSDTEIYVETPVGAAAIPVDVTVQKSDGDVIIPNGFVYLNPPPEAGEQQSHVVVIWNDAYLL